MAKGKQAHAARRANRAKANGGGGGAASESPALARPANCVAELTLSTSADVSTISSLTTFLERIMAMFKVQRTEGVRGSEARLIQLLDAFREAFASGSKQIPISTRTAALQKIHDTCVEIEKENREHYNNINNNTLPSRGGGGGGQGFTPKKLHEAEQTATEALLFLNQLLGTLGWDCKLHTGEELLDAARKQKERDRKGSTDPMGNSVGAADEEEKVREGGAGAGKQSTNSEEDGGRGGDGATTGGRAGQKVRIEHFDTVPIPPAPTPDGYTPTMNISLPSETGELITLRIIEDGCYSSKTRYGLKMTTPMGHIKEMFRVHYGLGKEPLLHLFLAEGRQIRDHETPETLELTNEDEIKIAIFGEEPPPDPDDEEEEDDDASTEDGDEECLCITEYHDGGRVESKKAKEDWSAGDPIFAGTMRGTRPPSTGMITAAMQRSNIGEGGGGCRVGVVARSVKVPPVRGGAVARPPSPATGRSSARRDPARDALLKQIPYAARKLPKRGRKGNVPHGSRRLCANADAERVPAAPGSRVCCCRDKDRRRRSQSVETITAFMGNDERGEETGSMTPVFIELSYDPIMEADEWVSFCRVLNEADRLKRAQRRGEANKEAEVE